MSEAKRRSDSDTDSENKAKKRKKTQKTPITKESLKFDTCDVLIEDGIETNADLDYVSMVNIAMSRHQKEFQGLKHELLEKEEVVPGLFLQRCLVSVWVLDKETGEKLRKLQCIRKARKVRFVKKAAYNGLIRMMMRVQPDLSYEPNDKVRKKVRQKQYLKRKMKADRSDDGLSRVVLEMLKARDKIDKTAAFRQNTVGDPTKGGEGMLWVTSCAVFVNGNPIIVTAETKKKRSSHLAAARKMVDRLLADCDDESRAIIRKYMRYEDADDDDFANDNNPDLARFANLQAGNQVGDKREDGDDASENDVGSIPEEEDSSEGSDSDGDVDVDANGKNSSNRTEFRICSRGIFDTKGDEFKLPNGYKITTAKTDAECRSFISQNIEYGTKVGVYVESRDVYSSVHYLEKDAADGNGKDEGCNLIALAVVSGACLIERKTFTGDNEEDIWPPQAVYELFAGTTAELCAYKMNSAERELGFTPRFRHRISDIQTCGCDGIEANGVSVGAGGINSTLKEIVEHWTSKKLDVGQLQKLATKIKRTDDVNDQGEEKQGTAMRIATAVQTAAAVLSAYHSICNARDTKIRNRVGPCAMKGFTYLMAILTGRKDLLSPVSAA